jgi:L-threonylcarbamoyladenylate synthase
MNFQHEKNVFCHFIKIVLLVTNFKLVKSKFKKTYLCGNKYFGMREKIHKAVEIMKEGGIILYPTDTIWGIGCDATNEEAIKKIYKLKKRVETQSMLVLVENERMLQNIVEVSSLAWDLIDLSEKPTTIIYDDPKNVAKNIIADDNTLGVRLIEPIFLKQLIGKLKSPIVSTSANISGAPSPRNFEDISEDIKNGVDYILDIKVDSKTSKSSCIIKLTKDSKITIIRK